MAELLFGAETEYAVVWHGFKKKRPGEETATELVQRARMQLPHVQDMSASHGVFLGNGARLYVDCRTHPEYCTPECTDPWDLVRQVEAGHRILASLALKARVEGKRDKAILCFRSNVDYSGSFATWASHENYQFNGGTGELSPRLIPHLVTRPIYTGAGGFHPRSRGLEFTLAPRLTYFERLVADNTTSIRGIWHDKSESLSAGYRRMHVICGESLCSQLALFLKFGVTAIIVAMADAGLRPGEAVQLSDPVSALQTVVGDVSCTAKLPLSDKHSRTAIEIQRHYLEMAEAHIQDEFMPSWAGAVCRQWRATLDRIETEGPAAVASTLDWAIKLSLYSHQARDLGIRWEALEALNSLLDLSSPQPDLDQDADSLLIEERALRRKLRSEEEFDKLEMLARAQDVDIDELKTLARQRERMFEIDMRFGELGAAGLFEAMDKAGVLDHRMVGEDEVERAMTQPPPHGRAKIRGQVVQKLAGNDEARCDWQQIVDHTNGRALSLSDPFIKEEGPWLPLVNTEIHDGQVFNIGTGFQDSGAASSPYSRRQDAADRILSGDFAGAEVLLRGLLEECFMLPSTRCHMARVLVMTDREPEARDQINQAWSIRDHADTYVVPRMLFFQLVFALLDETDTAGVIGLMRTALRGFGATLDWAIVPMLDHLRPRIGEENYEFLKVLAKVLSGSEQVLELEEFPQWRIAVFN